MRFYPVHILVKDLLLMVFYLVFSKVKQLSIVEYGLLSLLMMRGIIIIDILLQSFLYITIKHNIRSRTKVQLFGIGLLLHLPAALLWTSIAGSSFISLLALGLSGLVSGFLYIVLNQRKIIKQFNNTVTI
jgi:hypothetical protein